MNGTLLFRRSASIVLVGVSLAVAACGVDMSGLFQDVDGGPDGASRDGGQDVSTSLDGASDLRADTPADRSLPDGTAGEAGTDVTTDPAFDGNVPRDTITEVDATRDMSIDPDAVVEAGLDGDAQGDADFDSGSRDQTSDPTQDPIAEDTTTDPRLDIASDPTVDVVADVPVDRSPDRPDLPPPGICMSPCNTFANISQTITRTVDQGSPPMMTGGTVLDGTYVLDSIVQYNGDMTPFSLSETSVIAGNMDAWVSSTNGQAEVRYTTTFTTTNNQLAFSFCCPASGNLTILYTTDGVTLSHIDPGNPNRVITYTRQ